MNPENFTHKTNAHDLEQDSGHVQFTPIQLALSLISDQNCILYQTISNAGGNEESAKSAERVLTQAAKKIPSQSPANQIPISSSLIKVRRTQSLQRVVRILSRRTKNNHVLIGEPSVSKTVVVKGLAQRIVRGDVQSNLADVKLVALDMGALVAGAKYTGEFEEMVKSVLKEIEESNGKVIIFIDEIHVVLGVDKTEGSMDAANLFKPMLDTIPESLVGIG